MTATATTLPPPRRRISGHSGHFPSSSLNPETDDITGMSSLHPVTYPKDASRTDEDRDSEETRHNQSAPIDHTVQKLFASMSIAYNNSAQLAAPQFKAYKGLRITVKEKMRLNNIVWREWHLQYVKKRKNMKRIKICNFLPQMDGTHCSPTVIVLEGKYWKRSHEVVKNEYMRWRVFYKESMKHWKPDDAGISVEELLSRVAKGGHTAISSFVKNQNIRAHDSPPDLSEDDLRMDLSDSIFSTLHSIGFPHQTHRDLVGLESSDLMQPELIGLDPDLEFDEFDASEPLQELLADAMSLHLEHFKFTSGQKRPVYPEMVHATEESIMPPSSAYPAFKRSRSSSVQDHALTAQLLDEVESNDVYSNVYTTQSDDDEHLPPPSAQGASLGYDFNQNSQLRPYIQTAQNPLLPQTTMHSSQQLQAAAAAAARSSLQLQAVREPLHMQSAQISYRTRATQDCLGLLRPQTAQNPLRIGSAPRYMQMTHPDLLNMSTRSTLTMPRGADDLRKVHTAHSSVQNEDEFSLPPPPYSSSHHSQIGGGGGSASYQLVSPRPAAFYPSVGNSVTTDLSALGGSGYSSNPQTSPSTTAPAITRLPCFPYSRPATTVSTAFDGRLAENAYCARDDEGDRAEFKKPEVKVKPRASVAPTKPKPEEKSSFLTQLLGKPLDKDVPVPEIRAPPASPNQPIHPVYFPQFTPISYTPQIGASNSLPSHSHPYQEKSSRASGVENLSSPSAEEDKKDAPTAEQKRRYQIKTGFEALAGLVPDISTTTTSKTSKATMLGKTIEFINQLQKEESEMKAEIDMLTGEIDALDVAITQCQGQLPATGIPMVSRHKEHMQGMLRSYILEQTHQNWKFYVFSKLTGPLFDSFYSTVSTASVDEMYRSTQAWTDQHCSLVSLRPAILSSLRQICGETSILTNPAAFPDQAREASIKATKNSGQPIEQNSPNLNRPYTEQYHRSGN